MRYPARFLTLAGAAALLAAPSAYSQAVPAELGIREVIAKLENAGYTRIGEIEKDAGHWEVEAISPDGQRVELEIAPKDGSILRERPDDDD